MATNILMPALSPTMTEGTLARWLKKEGDQVKAGDIIAEIETDKATMEVEAVDEGVLGKILVGDGTQGVKVNDPIAVLVEAGEAVPSGGAPPAAKAPEPAQSPSQAAAIEGVQASGGKVAGAAEQPVTASPPPATAPAPAPKANGHDAGDRVFASPLARRMAQQSGLDLSGVKGSGPAGRIVKADIEAALAKGPAAQPAAAPQAAAPAPAVTAPHTPVPNSTIRKVIARRLAESKQTIPHFYVTMDFEIDALLKLRADLNAKSAKEGPGAFKLSVNDLVIKAAAATLRRVPQLNASYTEDNMILYEDVDISVAVSLPEGLIT